MKLWHHIKIFLGMPMYVNPQPEEHVWDIDLGENDILCILSDKVISHETAMSLKAQAEAVIGSPGRKCMVLSEGLRGY